MLINSSENRLKFPRLHYGPLCLKLLNDFIAHHKLKDFIEVKDHHLQGYEALQMIFDVMISSMGTEKRKKALKDAQDYCESLPPAMR